ncbi:MAG: PEP-CTERM sorting domain-containing protein [Roseateles sp.]|uniref:PEP-CTERM sorting domain-containing protein n=1 Tax=Roseateles sp. TaxID=1971397 RepID=UPI0040367D1D
MKQLHHLAAAAALAVAGLAGFAANAANAATVVVDVSGAQSINLPDEAGNTVWLIDVGAGTMLNSLNWAVTLNALAPSSLSDMQVSFGSASGPAFTFAPDALDGFSDSGSYAGSLDLTGLGIAAGADGKLRIEFSEGFKDFGLNVAEGQWLSGSLSFDVTPVPEPAGLGLALAGLALVGAAARRARRH